MKRERRKRTCKDVMEDKRRVTKLKCYSSDLYKKKKKKRSHGYCLFVGKWKAWLPPPPQCIHVNVGVHPKQ